MFDRDEADRLIHDARKPLNRISMQAELLRMLTDSVNNEQIESCLLKIIDDCQVCSRQLQKVSHLHTGEDSAS